MRPFSADSGACNLQLLDGLTTHFELETSLPVLHSRGPWAVQLHTANGYSSSAHGSSLVWIAQPVRKREPPLPQVPLSPSAVATPHQKGQTEDKFSGWEEVVEENAGKRDRRVALELVDICRKVPMKNLEQMAEAAWQAKGHQLQLSQFHGLLLELQRQYAKGARLGALTTSQSGRLFSWVDEDDDGEVTLGDFVKSQRELRAIQAEERQRKRLNYRLKLETRRLHQTESSAQRAAEIAAEHNVRLAEARADSSCDDTKPMW
eukprot:CAMPEP_0119348070 /NCGR_PEP_ID=MMETSP1333-20130426/108851_1 /TAXON_ID=418940 /ORGANISM="Scyphosphaera apsteinii, Strain RCC1455" /LENGTH=261 /DNA_ID=CAMNT_0007360635 /DNA_START=660 /DNA_END=1442 /DNA_ORIENTATION=+